MFVKDLIQDEDIDKWRSDIPIIISSGTGSGKTSWVLQELSTYCSNHKKKILYCVNRTALYRQVKAKSDNIDITSYQQLAKDILQSENTLECEWDYIVCDEAHYFFSDSSFNEQTDIAFSWLHTNDAINIYMTATPEVLKDYFSDKNKKYIEYSIGIQYHQFVNKLYFYDNDKSILSFLMNRPKEEKSIYFTTPAKAYKASCALPDASFICAIKNKLNKYSNKSEYGNIIHNQRFKHQVLCTTSVLDNGINIYDDNLVNIIVDYVDLDEIQQMIGRKRFHEGKSKPINIFIKNHNKSSINGFNYKVANDMIDAEHFLYQGEEEFVKNHYKSKYKYNTKLIYDYTSNRHIHKALNYMMYYKLRNRTKNMNMMSISSFKEIVCKRLGYQVDETFTLDDIQDRDILQTYLAKKLNVPLYAQEKEELKQFITTNDNLFNTAKTNHGCMGIKLINGYLEELKLPFIVENCKRDNSRKSKYYNQRPWIIQSAAKTTKNSI